MGIERAGRRTGAVVQIRGCSPKEISAIDEFFRNDFNQKKACKSVGFAGSGIHIWRKEAVRREVQRRLQKIERDRQQAYDRAARKNNITKENLVSEYAKMAFAPLTRGREVQVIDGKTVEYISVTQEQRDIGADIPVDARDKKTALDSLAKMEGLFVEHLKISDEREVVDALLAGRQRVAALKAAEDEEDDEAAVEEERPVPSLQIQSGQ